MRKVRKRRLLSVQIFCCLIMFAFVEIAGNRHARLTRVLRSLRRKSSEKVQRLSSSSSSSPVCSSFSLALGSAFSLRTTKVSQSFGPSGSEATSLLHSTAERTTRTGRNTREPRRESEKIIGLELTSPWLISDNNCRSR